MLGLNVKFGVFHCWFNIQWSSANETTSRTDSSGLNNKPRYI